MTGAPLRFGLLGTGWWARATQGPGLVASPDAELVGVWGRDAGKAADLAVELGATAYADVDRLFADVDAVAIALPPDIQAPLAVRAARRGKHLVLDKPLALALDVADEVVTAVRQSGVAAVVFFTGRFQPRVEEAVQKAVASGSWDGARVTVFVSVLNPGGVLRESGWRVAQGGLWDAGPHTLSPVVPVLGRVVEVSAMVGPHRTSHVLARHAGGAVSAIATTLEAPAATGTWEIELHGDAGWLRLPGWELPAHQAFGHAVSELRAMVVDGTREHRCDVGVARDVVAVLEAAATAQREGRTVAVSYRDR